MKTLVSILVVSILMAGIVAGVTYPQHPKAITIISDGSGPTPIVAPGRPGDRGTMFPDSPRFMEGSGPTPILAPDQSGDRGTMFPNPR